MDRTPRLNRNAILCLDDLGIAVPDGQPVPLFYDLRKGGYFFCHSVTSSPAPAGAFLRALRSPLHMPVAIFLLTF